MDITVKNNFKPIGFVSPIMGSLTCEYFVLSLPGSDGNTRQICIKQTFIFLTFLMKDRNYYFQSLN